MGLSFTKLFSRLFEKKGMRILMVGLDAAGKTTRLYKLKLGEIVTAIPTIDFWATSDHKKVNLLFGSLIMITTYMLPGLERRISSQRRGLILMLSSLFLLGRGFFSDKSNIIRQVVTANMQFNKECEALDILSLKMSFIYILTLSLTGQFMSNDCRLSMVGGDSIRPASSGLIPRERSPFLDISNPINGFAGCLNIITESNSTINCMQSDSVFSTSRT